MKKQTKSSLTRKLDKECSRIVRGRGYCEWGISDCSGADHSKLQTAHIYSRTYKSVRWDLKNMLCLCAGCHFFGHKNPLQFAEFVKLWLGDYEYEKLKIRAVPVKRWTIPDMQSLLTTLEAL